MYKLFRSYKFATVSRAADKKPLIGFIGLGNMGGPMALNLVKGGYSVIGYDTSKQRLEELKAQGITPSNEIISIAKEADIVITMLPNTNDVQKALIEGGIFKNAKKGSLLIDSSTINPIVAKELNQKAKSHQITFVDAPVSGGVTGAAAGTLTFMVGAENAEIYNRCKAVLEKMGKNIVNCESPGAGQIAKICNNLALGIEMVAVAEALNLGKKLGIDLNILTNIMKTSTSRCWSVDSYHPVPGMMEGVPSSRDYERGFGCALILKDLKIAQEVAKQAGAPLPSGDQVTKLYENLVNAGKGTKDFSIIYQYLEKNGKL